MNSRGFTLVELLAAIVILGLVMGIASYGVLSAIQTSRARSEKIFVDKLSDVIGDYLSLNESSLDEIPSSNYQFCQCVKTNCQNQSCESDGGSMISASELTSIYINDLVSERLVDDNSLINPANKKKCFSSDSNPVIRVFQDENFVYYYYVDLRNSNTLCEISDENGVINTLPSNLKGRVGLS